MSLTIADMMAKVQKETNLKDIGYVTEFEKVKRLPSGSFLLDQLLGGGWAVGRINTIFGEPSHGKSTLALLCAAYTHKIDPNSKVLYVDMEETFDAVWAEKLGVDMNRMGVIKPPIVEDALRAIRSFIQQNYFDLIIYDSLMEGSTAKQLEADPGDVIVADRARIWTSFLQTIKHELALSKTCFILLNQTRANIAGGFMSVDYSFPGAKAVQFNSSIIVKIRRGKYFEKGLSGFPLTIDTKTSYTKNKTAPAFKTAEITFVATKDDQPFYRIDLVPELVKLGKEFNIFTKEDGTPMGNGGNWYYRGEKIATSFDSACEYLHSNEEVYNQLLSEVYDLMT